VEGGAGAATTGETSATAALNPVTKIILRMRTPR
jgi:hypothetical protein